MTSPLAIDRIQVLPDTVGTSAARACRAEASAGGRAELGTWAHEDDVHRHIPDVVGMVRELPLRERLEAAAAIVGDLFTTVRPSTLDWGDDAERAIEAATVDEELTQLRRERRALVAATAAVVEMARSLETTARLLADHHARTVVCHDALDFDQLDRRLSEPGEFAGDDFAPLVSVSPAAAARWAEIGGTLRARHPMLLALAGAGRVRMRVCEIVVRELDHLDVEQASAVEEAFCSEGRIHASEASVTAQLRERLRILGWQRPCDLAEAESFIDLAFTEHAEQPTLTDLRVTMPADDAWKLDTAIRARARVLVEEWADAKGSRQGYTMQRARVDALIDLALGAVRFAPDVRITVPVSVVASGKALGQIAPLQELSARRASRARPPWRGEAGTARDVMAAGAAGGAVGTLPATVSTSASKAIRSSSVMPLADVADLDVADLDVADLDISGIGRVSSEAVRALGAMLGAVVTVALADSGTGVTAWSSSTTYRPSVTLRRHVEARDGHCRFPGCMRATSMCDADHVVAHGEGGATSVANLQMLCRHHHRAKTFGAWAVAMRPDGVCVWQSPTGHWFRTHPKDATAYCIDAGEGLALVS